MLDNYTKDDLNQAIFAVLQRNNDNVYNNDI